MNLYAPCPMKLALINQFYPPDISPTAHLCASLAEHRAALGDDLTVITSRSGYVGRLAGGEQRSPVHVIRAWSTRLGSRSRLRRLIDWGTFYLSALLHAALLPAQDAIISLTTPPYIAWAAILHKLLHRRTRIILWNMDCYPEALERTGMLPQKGDKYIYSPGMTGINKCTYPLFWGARRLVGETMRAMNRAIFRRLDHLVCLDGAMAELLSQYKPKGRQLPTSIIPNWEKAELFENLDPPPMKWGEATAAAVRDRFVVLYLGNAGFGHEFATMIEAADLLRNDPVVFLFVGGGARREWIAEQARRRGLTNIVLHDYVPKEQTPSVMKSAGCALITLENQMAGVMSPSKLHANLAMGLPIVYVGPKRSNVHEAIERFGCGVSLRPGKAEEMARSILQLMNETSMMQLSRQRARHAFDNAFSDNHGLKEFDKLLSLRVRPITH